MISEIGEDRKKKIFFFFFFNLYLLLINEEIAVGIARYLMYSTEMHSSRPVPPQYATSASQTSSTLLPHCFLCQFILHQLLLVIVDDLRPDDIIMKAMFQSV